MSFINLKQGDICHWKECDHNVYFRIYKSLPQKYEEILWTEKHPMDESQRQIHGFDDRISERNISAKLRMFVVCKDKESGVTVCW